MKWLLDLLGISASQSGQELDQAVEHVVEGTDPRLRLIPNYRRKLLPAVQSALTHIDATVDQIPGPVELTRNAFATDPTVKALFATADDLSTILHNSCEVSPKLLDVYSNPDREAWALLCTEKEEKRVLGMELAGNDIHREVAQTVVNFYDHKILSPAACDDEVRCSIKRCIFDGLITYALQHIVEQKTQRRELEDQRRILHARLRARQTAGNGLSTLLASASTHTQTIEDIEDDLRATEAQLAQLPPNEQVLQAYLADIQNIFSQPEQFICMNTSCLRVNHMGVVVEHGHNTKAADTVCFSELEIAGVLRRVVCLVHFPCVLASERMT